MPDLYWPQVWWQLLSRAAATVLVTRLALQPFITANDDLENWMRRGASAKVQAVSFEAVAARWLYREPFKVTLRPLDVPE